MTTLINNSTPGRTETPIIVERSDDSAGWAVAVIVLLMVLAAGAYLWSRYHSVATVQSAGTNINVSLPSPVAPAATGNSGAQQ